MWWTSSAACSCWRSCSATPTVWETGLWAGTWAVPDGGVVRSLALEGDPVIGSRADHVDFAAAFFVDDGVARHGPARERFERRHLAAAQQRAADRVERELGDVGLDLGRDRSHVGLGVALGRGHVDEQEATGSRGFGFTGERGPDVSERARAEGGDLARPDLGLHVRFGVAEDVGGGASFDEDFRDDRGVGFAHHDRGCRLALGFVESSRQPFPLDRARFAAGIVEHDHHHRPAGGAGR